MKKSEKYELSIRKTKKASKEDAKRMDIKFGEEYSFIPPPKNIDEVKERFHKLEVQGSFEIIKYWFTNKFGVVNEKILTDELEPLKVFIKEANSIPVNETFANTYIKPKNVHLWEYSRLVNGYYDNPNKAFQEYGYFNPQTAYVYARYFLYKDWLTDKLKAIESNTIDKRQDEKERAGGNIVNPFNTPYNGMYTVSQRKTRFKLANGNIQHRGGVNDTYDLVNKNLFDNETGELIQYEPQSTYNTLFLLKLDRMYIPNVKPYLTHQLAGSSRPTEFLEYVKYCALNSEIIENEGKKQSIRDWLTELQVETPSQPIISEQNRNKKVITEMFELMDQKGFEYAFRNEQDYNTFIDILTNFFEFEKYSLPKLPIELKRGCKTKLASTLGKIHSELSNVDKFSGDTDYFNIVRCLSPYSTQSNDKLYKSLTRNRKDY